MPRNEIQTQTIINDIFEKGKTCFVPRWCPDSMEMVKLHSLKDYLSLPVNRWNIAEPSHDEEREIAVQLDMIVMPGMNSILLYSAYMLLTFLGCRFSI